jgi:hypothetical protein
VDGSGQNPDRVPRNHPNLLQSPGIGTDPEAHLSGKEEDGLVLYLVVLEREGLSRMDVEDLPDILRCVGPDQLMTPRFVDSFGNLFQRWLRWVVRGRRIGMWPRSPSRDPESTVDGRFCVVKAPGISGGGSLEEALGSAVIRLHSRRCGQETAAETRDDTHGSLYMSGWAVNSSSSETREMTVDAGKADLQEP